MDISYDPSRVQDLVGNRVEGSNDFSFSNSVIFGTLEMNQEENRYSFPFLVGGIPCTFIREVRMLQYRPFANAKEFEPHREKWLRFGKVSNRFKPNWYDDTGIGGMLGLPVSYETVFKDCTFEDGSKCGVLV